MDLEEDAMLVAIGFMGMGEARDKWADRWQEFVKSLSKWKSVHQLLRIARLNQLVAYSCEADAVVNACMSKLRELKGLMR